MIYLSEYLLRQIWGQQCVTVQRQILSVIVECHHRPKDDVQSGKINFPFLFSLYLTLSLFLWQLWWISQVPSYDHVMLPPMWADKNFSGCLINVGFQCLTEKFHIFTLISMSILPIIFNSNKSTMIRFVEWYYLN